MANKVNMYETSVKVVSQKGHCFAGQNVGDEWVVGAHTPAGICIVAFNSMLPVIRTLRYGGLNPGPDAEMSSVACPDAANPVVYEVRRIRK